MKCKCVLNCLQVAAAFYNSPQPALAAVIKSKYGNKFPGEGLPLVIVLAVHLMLQAKIKAQPAISQNLDWAYWFCGLFPGWAGLSLLIAQVAKTHQARFSVQPESW